LHRDPPYDVASSLASQAYQILSDAEQRQRYNAKLEQALADEDDMYTGMLEVGLARGACSLAYLIFTLRAAAGLTSPPGCFPVGQPLSRWMPSVKPAMVSPPARSVSERPTLAFGARRGAARTSAPRTQPVTGRHPPSLTLQAKNTDPAEQRAVFVVSCCCAAVIRCPGWRTHMKGTG
jgi:hypothetical protein